MKLIRQDTCFTVTDFKRVDKYQYAKYTRDDDHGPRTYLVNEKKVPSVTTILSKTASKEKQASLDAWRERVGYQQAQEITSQAAIRGTEMHYVLENYMNGIGYLNLSSKGAQSRIMAHKIIENLEPLKIIYGNEVSLAYDDQWAGSTDLVGNFDGKDTIIDFKQANRVKKEEYIEDYFLQSSIYAYMFKERTGISIGNCVVIIASDELTCQIFEFKPINYLPKIIKRLKSFRSQYNEIK